MLILALANLTQRKVRSCLSILAVAIAIAMMLIMVGLSSGTLNDVAGRMQSVQAEILVRDRHFDLGSVSGGKLWEKEIGRIRAITIDGVEAVEEVMPVFLGRMKLAGLSQNIFGVNPSEFRFFAGARKLLAGELFADIDRPAPQLYQAAATAPTAEQSMGLPLIIDQKLSKASGLSVGDSAGYGDIPATITAIVETGVAGRVFAPINLLRSANGISAETAHMFFVKANRQLTTEQLQSLCEEIESQTTRDASLVANYRQVLNESFKGLAIFVNLVSLIALVICLLFILVTMYTIVLERTKEIAILKSLGATSAMILKQTVQEAVLICSTGTVLGILLSYAARFAIQTAQPLMTIEMKPQWLVIAAAVGLIGGTVSAIYPGYIAVSQDPVEALSFE